MQDEPAAQADIELWRIAEVAPAMTERLRTELPRAANFRDRDRVLDRELDRYLDDVARTARRSGLICPVPSARAEDRISFLMQQ